ncbi:uncharacterized protein [Primulina huaijiensis]|uniref:uncharacterized protein n=1 Tax=Primulina huaijiensis TaxID=1492673 RepID=UPI003CC6FE4E
MISVGSSDGDSNRAKKSRSRRDCMEVEGVRKNEAVVSFGPEDLKGVNFPHSNALVIQARVANYAIMRVLVDSGSFVKVIFKEAFIKLDLQGYHLEEVDTTLFGFSGHVVYPEGGIVLPLTLGTRELKKTVMTTFTLADAPSSYNIILGRPAMNELRAVTSIYHQKIKFPVGRRVGEFRGNQPSSRKCYVETVRVDQKRVRQEDKRLQSCGEMERIVKKGEVQFVAEEEREKELIGISPLIAEHHLNILPGSQHVNQKKRHFGPEKDKVIDVQVRDLLKAGHIREIQFPTLFSNVGYHQILLAKDDQDKASFITSGGIFCYIVMPFGLKNAVATYQRLINKVFEKQLGRNVEVYVDDILGKSKEISGFISDLEETFATLM